MDVIRCGHFFCINKDPISIEPPHLCTCPMSKRKRKCTSKPKTLPNLPEYAPLLFVTGLTKASSITISHHLDKECSIRKASLLSLAAYALMMKHQKTFSIAELAQKNKRTILKDKSNFFEMPILVSHLLLTSLQASTGPEKVLKPFWNSRCQENSENLWLPTATDSAGLPSNSLNGLSPQMVEHSSYMINQMEANQHPQNKNLRKTFSPLSTSIRAGKWDDEGMPEKTNKALKIRINPTTEQKKLLKQWFGVSRSVYNKALAKLKELKVAPTTTTMSQLRAEVITKTWTYRQCPMCNKEHKSLKKTFRCPTCNETVTSISEPRKDDNPHVEKWETDVPKDIRDNSFLDLQTAYKAAFTNLKRGNIKSFNIGFKMRKSLREKTAKAQ